MFLFETVKDLQSHLTRIRQKSNLIGFVPTMGALHKGHLSLIQQSKSYSDCTVASIFVNPTQFNDADDLAKYPRTIASDMNMLKSVQNDVLFLPSVAEVYPDEIDTSLSLDFGKLDKVMEGYFRPGHFDGMAQVVKRLLDIVQPDHLYMGQKDFQQLTIVRDMIRQLELPVKLVMCPIIREADGLAMSSRNRRLTKENRENAVILSKTLQMASDSMDKMSPAAITAKAMDDLGVSGFKPEYFEIADGFTLQPIERFEDAEFIVACTAVWAGDIRLIDNYILKQPKEVA